MRQAEELQVRSLAQLARAVCRSAPLLELLEIAAEEAQRVVAGASVSISRIEPGTGFARTIINVGRLGPHEERWPREEIYELSEFAGLRGLVERGSPWRTSVDDPAADPGERALLLALEKGSAVGLPIHAGDQVWGELYVTRALGDPAIDEEAFDYLDALTAILSGALLRSVREQALTRLAFHDPLTGLPNRRALDEQAALAFQVPDGAVRVATAVMLDINGLKRVNDHEGHAVGDQLIRAVGQSLERCFSRLAGSYVARVGGDEFVVLVVGQEPALVHQVADEVCELTWNFGTAVTVSCGAASLALTPGTSSAPRELFAAADRAQYVAKRERSRRTVIAEDLEETSGTMTG